MTLPWDLEDWLTDTGDLVIQKHARGESLSQLEGLLYEIWVLDTETRNGGLCQYFANRGFDRWETCKSLATADLIPSFSAFAIALESLLQAHTDPYISLLNQECQASDLYDQYQTRIVGELHAAFPSAA